MRKPAKKLWQRFSAILLAALLSACGSDSSTPAVTAIPASATIFYAHNLVLKGDSLLATGYNAFGQLGTSNLVNSSIFVPVVPHYPFKGFATGGDHSVAFTNSSTVYTWGYNSFGQLGTNNIIKTHSSIPLPIALNGIVAVAAGAYHTLALKNDDSLWAWGRNDFGQVGKAVAVGSTNFSAPQQVAAAGFLNISSIAANGKHSLAVADGKVWGWGINTSGQLGVKSPPSFLDTPTIITGLPDGIAGVAAGGGFSYAVAKDGTLWAWGNNSNGQLGNYSYTASPTPVQVVTETGVPLQNVVRVAAGIQHGLAQLSDGTVWAWGYNHFGQLGNNSTLDRPFAVKVLNLAGVSDIRAFGSSSMAKAGDAWYAWGDNTYGQLGLGLTGIVQFPQKVLGF